MGAPSLPRRPQPHQLIYLDRQVVRLDDLASAPGWILDIGGGGDGIIGRLMGSRVVAIDVNPGELARVDNPSLKIVMDARCMRFVDQTFATATAFFSLMYMTAEDQAATLAQVYRVLHPGGLMLVWDVAMPTPPEPDKMQLMLPVTVELPDGTSVRTGYGASLKPQGPAYFADLALHSGFTVESIQTAGAVVHLRLRRPSG
jgi:SAM-dependent methyltransferase